MQRGFCELSKIILPSLARRWTVDRVQNCKEHSDATGYRDDGSYDRLSVLRQEYTLKRFFPSCLKDSVMKGRKKTKGETNPLFAKEERQCGDEVSRHLNWKHINGGFHKHTYTQRLAPSVFAQSILKSTPCAIWICAFTWKARTCMWSSSTLSPTPVCFQRGLTKSKKKRSKLALFQSSSMTHRHCTTLFAVEILLDWKMRTH